MCGGEDAMYVGCIWRAGGSNILMLVRINAAAASFFQTPCCFSPGAPYQTNRNSHHRSLTARRGRSGYRSHVSYFKLFRRSAWAVCGSS